MAPLAMQGMVLFWHNTSFQWLGLLQFHRADPILSLEIAVTPLARKTGRAAGINQGKLTGSRDMVLRGWERRMAGGGTLDSTWV